MLSTISLNKYSRGYKSTTTSSTTTISTILTFIPIALAIVIKTLLAKYCDLSKLDKKSR